MDDEVVIYVQQSEVEKLKSELARLKSFAGTVLPLEEYQPAGIYLQAIGSFKASPTFDLQGRRVSASLNDKGKMINGKAHKDVYIRDGRKYVR